MGLFSKLGKWTGGQVGEALGARRGERVGREAYEEKGFFGRLFTNEERFVNEHVETHRGSWRERGETVGKWTARAADTTYSGDPGLDEFFDPDNYR